MFMFKVFDKAKFEENIDSVQIAKVFRYGNIVGEILNIDITSKKDFYLLRIEFE